MRTPAWHPIPALVLALACVFLVPNTPSLLTHGVGIVSAVACVIGILALTARAWVDAFLAFIVVLSLWAASLLGSSTAPELLVIRTASILAFFVLSFALLLGPWARMLPSSVTALLVRARRRIGVTGFLLGLVHTTFVLAFVFDGDGSVITANAFLFLGFTMNLVLGALAITSWNRFQGSRSLVAWNIIHTALFLLWGVLLAQTVRTTAVPLTAADMLAFSAMGLFWILVAPWALPRLLSERVSGWKQLQRLTWVAYLALVLHATKSTFFGNLPLAAQLAVWAVVGLVLGSHVVGLFLGWNARRKASPAPEHFER